MLSIRRSTEPPTGSTCCDEPGSPSPPWDRIDCMRNPNCRKCGLWQSSRNACVWGDGPQDADIFVIGEAPGEAEARTGKPFQGKSGMLLREALAKEGLKNV